MEPLEDKTAYDEVLRNGRKQTNVEDASHSKAVVVYDRVADDTYDTAVWKIAQDIYDDYDHVPHV